MLPSVAVGDVVRHVETDRLVTVLAIGRMKVEEGPWYESVTYYAPLPATPTKDPQVFTREKQAFLKKFEKVD